MSTIYYKVLVTGLTYRGINFVAGQVYEADSVGNADLAQFTSAASSGITWLETTTNGGDEAVAIALPYNAPEVNDFSQGPAGAVQVSANSGGLGGDGNFVYDQVASAVNGIEVSSAATTDAPSIVATGSDTNVDLVVQGQGTGAVWLNGAKGAGTSVSSTGDLTLAPEANHTTQVGRRTTASAAGHNLTVAAGAPKSGQTDEAGGNLVLQGGFGTGAGAGGHVTVQTAPAGSTGTTDNTPVTALDIDSVGNVAIGPGGLSTSSAAGFPYIPVVAGTPTGAPSSKSGFMPIVFDSTDSKLCIYNGTAWVKTAALS